jgi:hypothetical protein
LCDEDRIGRGAVRRRRHPLRGFHKRHHGR